MPIFFRPPVTHTISELTTNSFADIEIDIRLNMPDRSPNETLPALSCYAEANNTSQARTLVVGSCACSEQGLCSAFAHFRLKVQDAFREHGNSSLSLRACQSKPKSTINPDPLFYAHTDHAHEKIDSNWIFPAKKRLCERVSIETLLNHFEP
jgi:hypothetical protein